MLYVQADLSFGLSLRIVPVYDAPYRMAAGQAYSGLDANLKPAEEKEECADPTKGFSLVMLSVATSIDALGVGFSLGVLNQNLFMVAVWIGIVAAAMTWLAMKIGNRLSQRFAHRMEIFGGLILILIAFKLLLA
jgi:putative Mn2+ efflux pump MntP